MYKGKLWDEDKWNIHSEGYNSSKYNTGAGKDEKKYHEQTYGSKEKDLSSDYIKKEDSKEKDDKKKEELFDAVEEKKKEEIKDEDIPFRAARQVFNEMQKEMKKPAQKKDVNSIEDAIKKAIEEEKKVIVMD
ncbi:MAG TPA: hypothetical protein VJJ52_05485 [Candidatus Nanoarchaeia archaeon]|nr:hypothetical protein [Candidatus Nanoarchaeia archaeon]